MTIQPIGTTSIALYLTPADLRQHGLSPEDLPLDRALELTRSACGEAGIELDGVLEIDAYPGSCGVLVFARVRPPSRRWFSFCSFEDLLAAAHARPGPPEESALFWWEDGWWLSLSSEAEQWIGLLGEFGSPAPSAPYLDARITEYGAAVLPKDALAQLARHFPAQTPPPPNRDASVFSQAVLGPV
ncbi:adaptor protein MecA [Pseudoflavonifractor sp. 524-17]|uniref:adaptor protein MecA n=1 Tax=Pseudoflavonifractor sp. 524-17 TaxID=2304577 RepID=UPI00192A485B|nr:adaptor protein MecA [Pseudoflavonifractor sp. 524-17]